ncbi:MAG: TrkA family potassium uptake protein [Nannocystis sp.]|nr:NAD-binding protein [Nannocystis sp.]MBA3549576.1 TrkA family potassium uptake protein [Nannocystis sp.]
MSSQRYLIIGLGRFGAALAESLSEQGAEVIAIDNRMTEVEAVKRKVAFALELDATDPVALQSVDPLKCTAVIVAIGENFEATVLTMAALREVGVTNIIARARSAREARILQAVGASEIIELETEMGRMFGRRLVGKPAESVTKTVVPGALEVSDIKR